MVSEKVRSPVGWEININFGRNDSRGSHDSDTFPSQSGAFEEHHRIISTGLTRKRELSFDKLN